MSDPSSIITADAAAKVPFLSYRELQKECGKAGLGAVGTAPVLRQRLTYHYLNLVSTTSTSTTTTTNNDANSVVVSTSATTGIDAAAAAAAVGSNDVNPPPAKRQKKEDQVFAMICPITLELPFVPVTAEDGRIYDEKAIEEYFATKPHDEKVPSPVTGVLMGKKLLPSPIIKNHIESLITNGMIKGELANKWIEKFRKKKSFDNLINKAQQGHALSTTEMNNVGVKYLKGDSELGIKKDFKEAFDWFEKAHNAGNAVGTAYLGLIFRDGLGTTVNVLKATSYFGMAAGKGSDSAACVLGHIFARPQVGSPADLAEACRFYELSLRLANEGTSPFLTMSEGDKDYARKKLAELKKHLASAAAAAN